MPKVLNFKVIIEQDEDGIFVASVPALPGCHTQGDTYEKALERIREVIELCLEEAEDDPNYKAKIDFGSTDRERFLGVTYVPIKYPL